MMTHVVSTRKAQTPRQPSLHVNAPMDLFGGYQINRPTHEDTRRKSKPQQQIDHDHQDSIAGEQQRDVERRPAERYVFRFPESATGAVMLQVSSGEGTIFPVQQPAMVDVFEGVAPD